MLRPMSLSTLIALVVPLSIALPGSTAAQDARSILQTMADMEEERWEGVNNYTIVKSVEAAGGLQAPQYFVKMDVNGQPTFRLVPPPVYEREMMAAAGFPPPGPELYEGMAMGYDLLGAALEQGGDGQPPMPGISRMTGQISAVLRFGAEGVRNLEDGSADAEQAVEDMQTFVQEARLEGTEPVLAHPDGTMRDAYRLVVDGLNLTQEADGGSFTLHSTTMWIDTEYYVTYRLLMEGEVASDGETTPLTIERLDLDYRTHGPLYVAHREVGRLSGIMSAMSDEDRRRMEEARGEMAEARAQLDAMPDGPAKQMAERMLLPQLEQFENMVEGEAFESAMNVASVAVNEGPPTPYGLGQVEAHGALTMASESTNDSGAPTAELSIATGLSGSAERTFSLIASGTFPDEGGSLTIVDANGQMPTAGPTVGIDSGSGSIVVTDRSETAIAGTFQAELTGTDANGAPVTISVNGLFDSGAPTGARQAPRGSPIPAILGL